MPKDRFPDIFIGDCLELEAMYKIQYLCDGLNGQYQYSRLLWIFTMLMFCTIFTPIMSNVKFMRKEGGTFIKMFVILPSLTIKDFDLHTA